MNARDRDSSDCSLVDSLFDENEHDSIILMPTREEHTHSTLRPAGRLTIVKRFISKAVRKFSRAVDSSSVSENRTYPQLCLQASRDDNVFADFRRNPIYNEILEHVSEQQGKQYLELIARDVELYRAADRFKLDDFVWESPDLFACQDFQIPSTLAALLEFRGMLRYS